MEEDGLRTGANDIPETKRREFQEWGVEHSSKCGQVVK